MLGPCARVRVRDDDLPQPRRPVRVRLLVVIAASGYSDLVAGYLVDQSVLVGDASRPVAVESVLEGLGLADANVGFTNGSGACDVVQQRIHAFEHSPVLFLPVDVVGPGVFIP